MNIRYLIFCCILFFLTACQEKQTSKGSEFPRPVRVSRVEALGTITRQYTGVVEAKEFSILAFKVPGTLVELRAEEGRHIRRGDLIARIKPYDYRLQYQTAEANYQAAQSIYERTQRLYRSDAVALQNQEIAEADYIRASSALNIAQRTLNYTILKAPFDGFIEKRYADNFEEILAGQAIVRLVNPDHIEIRFILPETGIQLLDLPKKIYVEFDSQRGKLFTSEIQDYIYSSDGSGIPVTLTITDKEFAPYRQNVFPGFSCKVTWEIDNMVSDKFVIPTSAILPEETENYVWIVDPETNTTHKQAVIIIPHGEQALVLSGLNSQDLIVTAGVSAVQEGQKVRPIENKGQ